jgi:hypothetical protein
MHCLKERKRYPALSRQASHLTKEAPKDTRSLVEGDLRCGFHALGVLVESAVSLVALFLNGGAVLHELFGYGLAGGFEYVDESAGEVLLGFAEEGDGEAVLAGTTGTGSIC